MAERRAARGAQAVGRGAALAAALAILGAGCASAPTPEERLEQALARLDARDDAALARRPGEEPEAALRRLGAANARLLARLDAAADDLAAEAGLVAREVASVEAERKPYLGLALEERLRAVTFSYLQLTRQLARIEDDHADIDAVPALPDDVRAEAAALRLTAALIAVDLTQSLVAAFDDLPLAVDVLNRPHERDHIPARVFERMATQLRSLRARARVRGHIEAFGAPYVQRRALDHAGRGRALPPSADADGGLAMATVYEPSAAGAGGPGARPASGAGGGAASTAADAERWVARAGVPGAGAAFSLEPEGAPDLAALAGRVYASPAYEELRADEDLTRVVLRGPQKLGELAESGLHDAGEALYPLQVFVSNVIGAGELPFRKPALEADAVATLRPRLRPGDILLRRCEFFVSNAFLPGWWGHAGVYVGGRADIEALGLASDPRVAPHLAAMTDGVDLVEAVGEGVRLDGLAHFMEADHVAALRPRWSSEDERREAVARAFAELGKAYDYRFDFTTDDTVVCSEVVYRAFDGCVELPLVKRFGRFTLTPDDIARARTGAPGSPLRLVYFFKDGRVAPPADFEAVLR